LDVNAYQETLSELKVAPRRWLITGVAGFIGSNLLETLLRAGQTVVGLDSFVTGSKSNLEEVCGACSRADQSRFSFMEGDIRDAAICQRACTGIDFVLHQAALGSVPRSIAEPALANEVNVNGFLNMLVAARDQKVRRFIYASSSAVYGDSQKLPKSETDIGQPLSPYGATKQVNELYAGVFSRCYEMQMVGLRYFNVFGPRQNPDGPYAAVIPRWIRAMLRKEPVKIFGDGQQSRDFCYVANVVQANLLAATFKQEASSHEVYNIAAGGRTSLRQLFDILRDRLSPSCPHLCDFKPQHEPSRSGDVPHSHADISKARRCLGYQPTHSLETGLGEALAWYQTRFTEQAKGDVSA
jgi:UDP-N-acetylglucosamine 4-epimerase